MIFHFSALISKYVRKIFHLVAYFFFQCIFATSKTNLSNGDRTKISQAKVPRSNLSGHIFLWFHWHLSEITMIPMAQCVGQQGLKALGRGSNPSFYRYSFYFINAILNFEDCFLLLVSKLLSSASFSRCFMKWNADFCSFFFIIIIIILIIIIIIIIISSKITTNLQLLHLNSLPAYYILAC